MPRLSIEKERELVARFQTGESSRALAKAFFVAVPTVYNVLSRHGYTTAGHRKEVEDELLRACAEGSPIARTRKKLGISESTATRILRARREDGDIVSVVKGRPRRNLTRLDVTRDAEEWKKLSASEQDRQVDAVYDCLKRTSFPFPPELTVEQTESEIARIKNLQLDVHEGKITPWSPIGVKLCSSYFPNRYRARAKNQISAWEAWHEEKYLKRAIRFQLKQGDPVLPHRVLRAITLQCRTPTIFRPTIAKFIYERYCPVNGIVWDPCAGYGGRAIGATVAGVRYIGTDVELETVEGNRRLSPSATIHHHPAETFEPPPVDLVFTSPPYFDRERYSQGVSQSWKAYKSFAEWMNDFLQPVIHKAYLVLPTNGHLVLNVANVIERKQPVPIVEETIRVAKNVGFCHLETLQMPLAAINRKNPFEPVLVFCKSAFKL